MSVNVLWSLTNGGTAISSIMDFGDVAHGSESSGTEIFIRHDSANQITNAALYVRQVSGEYSGAFTPASDLAEILGWGDATTETGFGGILVNFNATTSYATGWAAYNDKSPSGGFVHRTGVGDSETNAVDIPLVAGVSTVGVIPAGTSPNVRFKTKIAVPDAEDTGGVRQWESILRFTSTS
jgi:hypothetical protein